MKYFSKEERAKRRAEREVLQAQYDAAAKARKVRVFVTGRAVQEYIEVKREDGYLDNTFDNRIAELLNDPTVSNLVGPVVSCTGSNPAGNYADYIYTIWYRKE